MSLLADVRTDAGRAALAALQADPARALVGLDFDGTLAPIVPDPADARADPRVVPALTRLAAQVGRVAIVTGRPASRAVELGGLDGVPGLIVLGHYGLERWEHGTLHAPDPDPGIDRARAELADVLGERAHDVTVEDKGSALAVHTRRSAAPAATFDELRPALAALAERTGLALEPGRFVLELRPRGVDKGGALHSLAAESPPSCVLFAGDDLGDVAAFDAVAELRRGGVPGLCVCSGSDEVSALVERADLVVDGPAGVAAWLGELADLLTAPH